MPPRFPTLLLLMTLSAPAAWAQTAAAPEAARPLNLSLPRDAVWSSTVRPDAGAGERSPGAAFDLPDPGARPNGGAGQRGRMPYGSGYEARQREAAGGGQAGAGRGGGGHGMGRAR